MWLKPFIPAVKYIRQLGIAIPSGKADGNKYPTKSEDKYKLPFTSVNGFEEYIR